MHQSGFRKLAANAMAAAVALSLAGCGGEKFVIVPVSGVVTVDGKPVEGVHLTFQPFREDGADSAGYGAYGETDAQGRFTLTSLTLEGREMPGAVVGKHRIEMTAATQVDPSSDLNQFTREKIPRRYMNEPFIREITGETDSLNFELTSRP